MYLLKYLPFSKMATQRYLNITEPIPIIGNAQFGCTIIIPDNLHAEIQRLIKRLNTQKSLFERH